MKRLKLSLNPHSPTLVYDDLKGKVFSQFRVWRTGPFTVIDLLFEDKTVFSISMEPNPVMELCHKKEDGVGDLKVISCSENISVPKNG
jgi:hypothetical protein